MKKTDNKSGSFDIPAVEIRFRTVSGNSKFIATLAPAFNSDDARGLISRVRREFPDASHHVSAFIIGGGRSVQEYCSDDGEPSGTAGKPILTVLRGSGLGNAALVVTRYFGGTLLGKGGLVKAYTEAAQAAVKTVQRARLERANQAVLMISYKNLEQVRIYVNKCRGSISKEEFSDSVSMEVTIPSDRYPEFENWIRELSGGKSNCTIKETLDVLVPLK